MGISLSEFWGIPGDLDTGYTLAEYDLALQGFQKRSESQYQLLAWHACHIMNCWTGKGKTLKPEELLGKKKELVSKEDVMAQVKETNRKFKMKKQDKLLDGMGENHTDITEEEHTDFASSVLESYASHDG